MPSFNNIILMGHAGQDAKSGVKGERPWAMFSIATDDGYIKEGVWQSEVTWHDVVAFGRLAQTAAKVRKGEMIMVNGPMKSRKRTDGEGKEVTSFSVHAQSVKIIKPKNEPTAQQETAQADDGSAMGYRSEAVFGLAVLGAVLVVLGIIYLPYLVGSLANPDPHWLGRELTDGDKSVSRWFSGVAVLFSGAFLAFLGYYIYLGIMEFFDE